MCNTLYLFHIFNIILFLNYLFLHIGKDRKDYLMKKFYKLLFIPIFCLVMLSNTTSTVSAANNWAGFQHVTIGLSFKKWGLASFYTTVIPSKSSYYSKINMKLQRYSGGKWHTLTSGTNGDTSINMYSRGYYVTKGYTYRVYSTATVYKSKGGKKINSDTFIYKNKY